MSRRTIIVSIAVVLAAAGAGLYYRFMFHGTGTSSGGQPPLPTQTITVGGAAVAAEIALSDEARKNGLSKRASLPSGSAMLFVFPQDGNWGMWMPDMNFPIDIMWADASGKIVALDASVSPATYPTVFYPNTNARYVLEVPAGWAGSHGITLGSRMSLPK